MYTSSPACHNQTAKPSKFRKQIQITAVCIPHNKALQAVKEIPDDYERTFFNTTNFHRFHVHLFKMFSPQLNDQTDLDSIFIILLIHLLNQNYSLDTFPEQNNTDAKKFKKKSLKSLNRIC